MFETENLAFPEMEAGQKKGRLAVDQNYTANWDLDKMLDLEFDGQKVCLIEDLMHVGDNLNTQECYYTYPIDKKVDMIILSGAAYKGTPLWDAVYAKKRKYGMAKITSIKLIKESGIRKIQKARFPNVRIISSSQEKEKLEKRLEELEKERTEIKKKLEVF